MFSTFWFSSRKGRLAQKHSQGLRPKTAKQRAFFRPFLEILETRTLLSTDYWINAAGGDWNNPANWSNGTPGATDVAVINQAGITITHSSSASETINSLTSQANINWQNGSLSVSGAFNNSGTVTVQSGGLNLSGGGSDSGSFSVAAGAALTFGGTTTLTASSQVNSDGKVYFYYGSNAQVEGDYNVSTSGSTIVDGGTVDFSGTVNGVGSSLTVGDGFADVNFHSTALSVADLTLGGPSDYFADDNLTAGNITVSNQFDWLNGTVSGSGTTLSIAPTATLTMQTINGGGGLFWGLNDVTLNNNGTIDMVVTPDLGKVLRLSGGAILNNYGTFQLQQPDAASGNSPSSILGAAAGEGDAVNNYGSWVAAGQANNGLDIGTPFNNRGSVTVQSGTLNFAVSYLQTAGSTTLGGGSLAGELNIQGGVLTGSGTIAGDVTNGGQVTPGGTSTAGVLTITGNYMQTPGGVLAVDVSGPTVGTQYDQLRVGGNASLNGTLSLNLAIGAADLCGDGFRVLTFGSRSGDFTNEQSLTLANGLVIQPVYDATGLNLVVPEVATNVAITASADPSQLNQSVTFAATVTPALSGIETPTGTVQFQIDGANVGSPLTLVNGSASFSTSSLAVGNHTIMAVYSGDGDCLLASTGSLTQAVHYKFSGFLPPLSNGLTFAVNRTIPIQFQLSDYNGKAITSLSAVTSLKIQALDSHGNPVGAAFLPTSTNNQGSQSSGGQYQFNWQTKGLTAGSYQIVLTLADGTTQTKTIQLTASGSSAGLVTDGSGGTATAGALLGGEVDLYVDNSNGDLSSDELARIQDAVTSIDTTIAPYGVTINEVSDPTQANVTLNMNTTSSLGGVAQGVLGCTTDADQVTMIQGWSWYAGADATQIGAGQYDFETAVVHELGHVLGLGHSSNPASVMYATLAAGSTDRTLVAADLNVPDSDSGPCALHAVPPATVTNTSNGQGMTALSSTSIPTIGSSSSGSPLSSTDQVFTDFARMLSAAWNAYQSELSSVSALWQTADALALQRLDALLSIEAGAMGMSKDTLMSDLFFADNSALSRV
jgi:hypothetical protein